MIIFQGERCHNGGKCQLFWEVTGEALSPLGCGVCVTGVKEDFSEEMNAELPWKMKREREGWGKGYPGRGNRTHKGQELEKHEDLFSLTCVGGGSGVQPRETWGWDGQSLMKKGLAATLENFNFALKATGNHLRVTPRSDRCQLLWLPWRPVRKLLQWPNKGGWGEAWIKVGESGKE